MSERQDVAKAESTIKTSSPFNNVWIPGIVTGIISTAIFNGLAKSVLIIPNWISDQLSLISISAFKLNVLLGATVLQSWIYGIISILLGVLLVFISRKVVKLFDFRFKYLVSWLISIVIVMPLFFYSIASELGLKNYLRFKETVICANLNIQQERDLTRKMLSSIDFREADTYIRQYNCNYRFIPLSPVKYK